MENISKNFKNISKIFQKISKISKNFKKKSKKIQKNRFFQRVIGFFINNIKFKKEDFSENSVY